MAICHHGKIECHCPMCGTDAAGRKPNHLELKPSDYAYKSIEEYEEITGVKVNDAFRIGWDMARATMGHLRSL